MDKINEIPGDALERILSKFDACVEELLRKPETLLRQFCDENDAYTIEEDYCEKNGVTIEGLKKPKNDISEGEEEEEY